MADRDGFTALLIELWRVAGVGVPELAARTKLHRNSLYDYRSGRHLPNTDALRTILAACGVTGELEIQAWRDAVGRAKRAEPPRYVSPAAQICGELTGRLDATAERELDVLAVGAHNMDLLTQVERIDTEHEEEIQEQRHCCGGSGANTMAALAGMGLRTGVAGIVADDHYGKAILADLRHRGVNTDLMLTTYAEQTGFGIVLAERSGARSIYVCSGANRRFAEEAEAKGLDAELVAASARARVLHLTSFAGAAERRLQRRMLDAVSPGSVVSFTPGELYAALGADQLGPMLTRTNVLFLQEPHLDLLLARSSAGRHGRGEVAAKMAALYEWRHQRASAEPLIMVVTQPPNLLSGRLAEYLTIGYGRSTLEECSGADIGTRRHELTDGTGAGDALAAGFLFGLLSRCSPADCGNLALLLALCACTELGARAGLINRAQLAAQWTTRLGIPRLPPQLG
ncbi:hypothetical protein D5S17_30515 [Pseudonocardiaceae bacterium YIM PH 21723]|nr:hypothetical protein D5S17_30515 [Pseudonocardiaceae bacterium YIM PH 21723]